MTVKRRVIAGVCWTVGVMAFGILAAVNASSSPVQGISDDERADQFAEAMGVVVCLGLGALWIPRAMKVGLKGRAAASKLQQRR